MRGPDISGFRLLESNADGLKWRLVLIDNARHTIDLQYYVWFGDASGQLLMARTIAAADRGVKVRILFDDLNTMLRRMTDPELRDAVMARIDRHPHIEIRVFNAWRERGWLGRAAEGVTDFTRLNHRMHNKLLVVDNRVAIWADATSATSTWAGATPTSSTWTCWHRAGGAGPPRSSTGTGTASG